MAKINPRTNKVLLDALRQRLTWLLEDYGIKLNSMFKGDKDDLIVSQLKKLLETRNRAGFLTEREIDRAGDILRRRRGSFHF